MEKIEFIDSREAVVGNIQTLYSYLNGEKGDEYRTWAIEKMVRGRNFVVEMINSHVCFAPSRFAGYVNNTMERHEANTKKDGKETDARLRAYYDMVQDDRLDVLLNHELSKYGVSSGQKKYWIPKDTTVDDMMKNVQKVSSQIPVPAEYDKFWHIQMHLPEGKGGEVIDSTRMLLEKEPVIGTGEWDDSQCYNFKTIENGNIVLVRRGSQAIALCQVIGENFTDDELANKYINTNYRKVKILDWAENYQQPRSGLFSQGTFKSCRKGTEQYQYIYNWLKHMESKAFTDKCARLLKT